MHPTTSPSDFIYRRPRPYQSVFAEFEHHPAPSSDNVDTSSNEGGSFATHGADPESIHGCSADHNAPTEPSSRPYDDVASIENAGLYYGTPFPRSEAPSPYPSSSLPFLRVVHSPTHDVLAAPVEQHDCLTPTTRHGATPSTFTQKGPEQTMKLDMRNQDRERRPSKATDSTISRTLSFQSSHSEHHDRFAPVLSAVHDICLHATKSYIISHLTNREARASHSDNVMNAGGRVPDGTSSDDLDHTKRAGTNFDTRTTFDTLHRSPSQHNRQSYPIPHTSDCLLKNISGICNMLWTGSQRDRLIVLNVERMAVENMGRLLSWGETVALGHHRGWTFGNEDEVRRLVDAGKNLCAWLGIQETMKEMADLESELLGTESSATRAWEL